MDIREKIIAAMGLFPEDIPETAPLVCVGYVPARVRKEINDKAVEKQRIHLAETGELPRLASLTA